jgi:hypothetical protein
LPEINLDHCQGALRSKQAAGSVAIVVIEEHRGVSVLLDAKRLEALAELR